MRRPTIVDIAKAAGVSKGAVSYALNGRPGVSDATRRRILGIAEELGWVPSSAARALSDGRAGTVGLIVDRPARVLGSEPFFMQLIAGIQSVLESGTAALLLRTASDRAVELDTYREWHAARRVDGVLTVDLRRDDPRIPVLEELGLPAVVIGGPSGVGRLPCVCSDDSAIMQDVVRYLTGLGHRRIIRVAGPPEFMHTETRSAAFAEAAQGLERASVVHADYSGSQSAAITRELLTAADPPTALVFDNDLMAVGALGAARDLGVAVPEQLSIVAWDDSAMCEVIRPALTAVRRDVAEHGRLAAALLLERVNGVEARTVATPAGRLVPRASTGAAPPR